MSKAFCCLHLIVTQKFIQYTPLNSRNHKRMKLFLPWKLIFVYGSLLLNLSTFGRFDALFTTTLNMLNARKASYTKQNLARKPPHIPWYQILSARGASERKRGLLLVLHLHAWLPSCISYLYASRDFIIFGAHMMH